MASVIKLKRSTTASAVPGSGTLAAGELAINLADKKLFSSSDGTNIITISGDQYNLAPAGNLTQGEIVLSVDNAALSNDTIVIVGTNGTVVSGNSTQITVDGTTYAVSTSGNSTIGQIVLTPTGGGDASADTLNIVGANGIVVSGNSTQITVTAESFDYDLSAGGNTTVGTIVLSDAGSGDADADTVSIYGANNVVVKNANATHIEAYLANDVSTATVTTTGLANVNSLDVVGQANLKSTTNSTSNTTGALVVSGGIGVGKSVTIGENLTVYGNFTVEGTTTTVNSTTVSIDDAALKLADNQADTTTFTDTADFGIYGEWGNTSDVHYSGIFRDASANAFVVVNDISTEPGATVTYNAANSTSSGDLGQLDAIIDGGTY